MVLFVHTLMYEIKIIWDSLQVIYSMIHFPTAAFFPQIAASNQAYHDHKVKREIWKSPFSLEYRKQNQVK